MDPPSWAEIAEWVKIRQTENAPPSSLSPEEKQVLSLIPSMLNAWRSQAGFLDPSLLDPIWISKLNETLQKMGAPVPPPYTEQEVVANAAGQRFSVQVEIGGIKFPNEEYGALHGNPPVFTTKKDGKRYAAVCALHYLLENGGRCLQADVIRALRSAPLPQQNPTKRSELSTGRESLNANTDNSQRNVDVRPEPSFYGPLRQPFQPQAPVLASQQSSRVGLLDSTTTKRAYTAPHGPAPTIAPRKREEHVLEYRKPSGSMITSQVPIQNGHQNSHTSNSKFLSSGANDNVAPVAPMVSSSSKVTPCDIFDMKNFELSAAKKRVKELCEVARIPMVSIKTGHFQSKGRTFYQGHVCWPEGHALKYKSIFATDVPSRQILELKLYDSIIDELKSESNAWELNSDNARVHWDNLT